MDPNYDDSDGVYQSFTCKEGHLTATALYRMWMMLDGEVEVENATTFFSMI